MYNVLASYGTTSDWGLSMLTIQKYGTPYSTAKTLAEAVHAAEQALASLQADERATFVVRDDASRVVASITNHRIDCPFIRHSLCGAGDSESFDATDAILQLDYERFLQLADGEVAESLIQSFLGNRNPYSADGPALLVSACDYFGVEYLGQVTPQAFEFAKERTKPTAEAVKTVELCVKVRVRLAPGVSLEDFTNDLDYNVSSNTLGAVVLDTEITGYDAN